MHRLAGLILAYAVTCLACSDSVSVGSEAEASPNVDSSTTATSSTTVATTTVPPSTVVETTTTVAATTTVAVEVGGRYQTRDLGEGWIEIDHQAAPGDIPCQCSDGSDWSFYAREGTAGASKVMVLFEGGGACWNELTCTPATGVYKRQVADGRDGYGATTLADLDGVFDATNPANPLADYTVIFIPYCTGDTHLGNAEVAYGDDLVIQHRGAINSRAAMNWVVDTYPDVDELFVTGMSAGSVPTPLFAGLLADELPDARVVALADASGAYPTAPEISAVIERHGSMDIVPDWEVYAGATAADLGIPALMWQTAQHNPDIVLARYDNAYDSVQAAFRTFLGIPADDLAAEILAIDAEIETNGRPVASYVAPGDDHTILLSNRLYSETVDGVAFVDWLTALVEGRPVDDVICSDCA